MLPVRAMLSSPPLVCSVVVPVEVSVPLSVTVSAPSPVVMANAPPAVSRPARVTVPATGLPAACLASAGLTEMVMSLCASTVAPACTTTPS